ncbi:MAG: fibrobacter succinogenes major paralogous domain-containing protein [Flavobacteriales bacterium]
MIKPFSDSTKKSKCYNFFLFKKPGSFLIFLLLICLFECKESNQTNSLSPKAIQRDTSYSSVLIGNLVWFSENLKVEKFRNGEKINYAKTQEEWKALNEKKLPAFAYYNFDSLNCAKMGKLYNWFAVTDDRMLAPLGWRIPSELDWRNLENHCDSLYGQKNVDIEHFEDFRQGTIELLSGEGWQTEGSNRMGFNALPCGFIDELGNSSIQQFTTGWWSNTPYYKKYQDSSQPACEDCSYCFIVNSLGRDYHNISSIGFGLYIRCVTDIP